MARAAFGLLRSHDLGVNGGWASLAEAHTALGIVASGFFLRGGSGILSRRENPLCGHIVAAVQLPPQRQRAKE